MSVANSAVRRSPRSTLNPAASASVPSGASSASAVSAVSAASPAAARRARLEAATHPVMPGPSTSAVAIGAVGTSDVSCVTLANAYLRLDVAPQLGGGITRFDWRSEGALEPVFRRCERVSARMDPNELACYPLLPYSNRIGEGRFHFGGRDVEVPRNRASEPLPIHGDGWLAHWAVEEADRERVRLVLDHSGGDPYAYRAELTYALDGATLVMTLEVENTGREALPFGLGVHPFLARDTSTELSAPASGLWLSGADWLPVRHVPAPPAWQFGVAYPLPAQMVNHAFSGWSGRAAVVWERRRLSLSICANTDYYVLYTPPGERFFCFEPVDHPINAVNLEGGGGAHGMTVLGHGERLVRTFSFTVERMDMRAAANPRRPGARGLRRRSPRRGSASQAG
ncbi:aldose 1-epimerase [Paraburkholderia pallida]|uniref:Aldose 1-epimerase n=1 Tax=Paraburkholderia pallida TaxID=2547399 RepID=A0A4P7CMV2_9BURK|nr:aldose 1-epimerase [Paraburkholderia pallida]QBQ95876.1 aldose 1-epimerase [Paraburkholderia pallida]